jgi:hypothetical protein
MMKIFFERNCIKMGANYKLSYEKVTFTLDLFRNEAIFIN